MIPVRLQSSDGKPRTVDALVDSGAEVNCITPTLAKELGWVLDETPTRTIKGIDGREVMSFGIFRQQIAVTDSLQREKRQDLCN